MDGAIRSPIVKEIYFYFFKELLIEGSIFGALVATQPKRCLVAIFYCQRLTAQPYRQISDTVCNRGGSGAPARNRTQASCNAQECTIQITPQRPTGSVFSNGVSTGKLSDWWQWVYLCSVRLCSASNSCLQPATMSAHCCQR